MIASLTHPNIVKIHEVGECGGLPFLILEFCPGGSLADRLAGTPMEPRKAACLARALARAVQKAHQAGVVHRDLKPGNVLMDADDTPKVADFGLAKQADVAGRTVTGAFLGTPSYAAPEQAQCSKDVGPAADVYSLGAILYECLTGRPPFKAATVMDTLVQVVGDEPVQPRQLQSKTPRDLETVCLKCLNKRPEHRYGSAEALAEDLDRFLSDRPILARPTGRAERAWRWCRRNPVVSGLVAAVAVALVVGSAVALGLASWALGEKGRADTQAGFARAKGSEARLGEAEALIGKARGLRTSRRSGQRFAALTALKEASAIGRELGQPPGWFDQVRNEAVNALALPDLYVTQTFEGFPPGTANVDMSDDFALYSRTTGEGGCTVRRIADDVEVAPFPAADKEIFVHFGPGRLFQRHDASRRHVELWDMKSRPELLREELQAEAYMFRPDGRVFALRQDDGAFSVYETETGVCRLRLAAKDMIGARTNAFLHPTRPIAAFAYWLSPLLQIRDLNSGAVLLSHVLPWNGTSMCAWSPDGRTLATCHAHSSLLRLYDFDPARPALSLRHALRPPGEGGTLIYFNPAGDRLVSRGFDNVVHLFDVVTGRLLFSTFSWPAGHLLRFEQSGRRLAGTRVGDQLQQIGIWSVADGREFRVLVHNGQGGRLPDWFPGVPRPAVHPNGRLAASGAERRSDALRPGNRRRGRFRVGESGGRHTLFRR